MDLPFEENIPKKKEHPIALYVCGIFCLIPLVGFILGLVYFIIGLTTVKNKIVVAIGVFGMLFTVAVYGSLFYYGFNYRGGVFDELTAKMAQENLNGLVKEIEFYKVANGNYPARLDSLKEREPFASINDPILEKVRPRSKDNHFRYGLRDNGYYLFSVGFDTLPRTKDDLRPTIKIKGDIGLKNY